jgi:hypothetical protein
MPGCLNIESIVTRKLEDGNIFITICAASVSGGMEINMNIEDLLNEYKLIGTDENFDKCVRQEVISKGNNYKRRMKNLTFAVIFISLISLTNVSVYAISDGYRNWLAKYLGINETDTHYIGNQSIDNNITLEVVSSHVVDNTAVVLVTFKHNNGERFNSDLISDEIILMYHDEDITSGLIGIDSELSSDSEILKCILTFNISNKYLGNNVTFQIHNLISKEPQKEGYNGMWETNFVLNRDIDNYTTKSILKKDKIVNINCDKYKLNSISLADTFIIISAELLAGSKPEDYGISSQYGAVVKIEYMDGREEIFDCIPDNDNNLIIWSFDTNFTKDIKQVYLNDIKILD